MFNRTMVSASNTMSQLQQKIDSIGNNLSNTDTTGYKSENATFGELLYQQYNNDKKDGAPRQTPLGIRIGVGAQIAQTQLNQKQGSLKSTGRHLDFALTKENQYFNVNMGDRHDPDNLLQIGMTRNGNFQLSPNEDGTVNLTDANGNYVLDVNSDEIVFKEEPKDIGISEKGIMEVTYQDGTTEDIGLWITQMNRPDTMIHREGGYLIVPDNLEDLDLNVTDLMTELNGDNRNLISLENGVLEASNVDTSAEMTDLIQTQRSYQFNARTVSMADQMMGLVNSIRS
jgi:flagellar basal-body rod protein FlgG